MDLLVGEGDLTHPTMLVNVQSLGRVRLLATPWTAAHQASYSSLSPRVCSDSCDIE